MNVVILAGGMGTRFKELSVFPKILLPSLKYDSILLEQVTYFDPSDSIYLVINSKYYKMVANYIRVNGLKDRVTLIESDNTNGSLNTLASVYDKLPKTDVMFFWSDILLDHQIDFIGSPLADTIYTARGNYRYAFDGTAVTNVSKAYDGNIPGIYYLCDIEGYIPHTPVSDNLDLVDILKEKIEAGAHFSKVDIGGLTEYRDLESYVDIMKTYKNKYNTCRFFNSIKFTDTTATKRSVDHAYDSIIEKELRWYSTVESLNVSGYDEIPCPEILADGVTQDGYPYFTMERCNGYVTLYEFLNKPNIDEDTVRRLYDNIFRALDTLGKHKYMVSRNIFEKDLSREVVSKVIDRCDKISDMLLHYDREELVSLLARAYAKLSDVSEPVEYTICHGDLNSSNIMIDEQTLAVKFIDPRGYFGNTRIYGWPKYEKAKLLYGLYGYDHFNTGRYVYGFDKPKESKYLKVVEGLEDKDYQILVGVIYIALAGYISQDIMKANIAYEYGLELLEKSL